ncbi:DUF1850 domain-containing protein [Pseudalkalibacillus sp. Hm43]|uniref:DUF1850 domain-containing protein n=1 Tax=Pseudalkalibacillus sp. Hm43 TaxID=3450742 RepID=UPI003F42FCAD
MKQWKKWSLLILLVIGLLSMGMIPYGKVLALQLESSGQVLVYMDVNEGTDFRIRYTHSVHQTPVTEFYEINEVNQIVQTKLAYENFAIGMPSNATGEEKFIEKDGIYYITNMNREFSHVDLRTGQVIANHTLMMDDNEIPLKNWVEPGSWIRLEVRPISLWQRLKGEDILG